MWWIKRSNFYFDIKNVWQNTTSRTKKCSSCEKLFSRPKCSLHLFRHFTEKSFFTVVQITKYIIFVINPLLNFSALKFELETCKSSKMSEELSRPSFEETKWRSSVSPRKKFNHQYLRKFIYKQTTKITYSYCLFHCLSNHV